MPKKKGRRRSSVRLSEQQPRGNPFITHLGDGDESLQPQPLQRASTPEEDQLQLIIPELDNSGAAEHSLNDSNNKEQSSTELKEEDSQEQAPPPADPPTTKVRKTQSPKSRGRYFVTSRNFIKEKISNASKPFEKQVYFVSSSPEPHLRPESRCTNVTGSLNQPVVTPIVENPYARVDSGYSSSRYSQRSHSANSLRKFSTSPAKMSTGNIGTDYYTSANACIQYSANRSMEKEELQRINERFAAYVQRVRLLREQSSQFDTTAFIKSTKILEDEVANIKALYERELEAVRKQLEENVKERNTLQMQCSKSQQFSADLESRLMVETEKNRKLSDEMVVCQRRMKSLESEMSELRFSSGRPFDEVNNLQRDADNLRRENETLKHRYEKELLARQEAEEKIQQLTKKLEFDSQVHTQQMSELRERLDHSTATVISLESRVRDLSKADTTIPNLIQQVRESAEEGLRRYQAESEENYTRNITSLKAQMENDASALERANTEKSQILGQVVELRAKITSLEGQIHNLQHQKSSLEELMAQEKSRSAEQIAAMGKKLKEVQEMLFVKMREANVSRDCHIPLKAEIEAIKVLLEEEERRIHPSTTDVAFTKVANRSSPTPVFSTVPHPQPSAPPMLHNTTTAANAGMTTSTSYHAASATNAMGTMSSGYDSAGAGNVIGTTYVPMSYSEAVNTLPEELDPVGPGMEYMGGGTRYTYQTSPSVNKLQIEPSPPTTPRAVGPVVKSKSENVIKRPLRKSQSLCINNKIGEYIRPNSADSYDSLYSPCSPFASSYSAGGVRGQNVPLIPTSLGKGQDYFDEMFRDLARETLYTQPQVKVNAAEKYQSSVYHDYNTSTSSRAESPEYPRLILSKDALIFSAIGDIKILEVNQEGKYVRLVNESKQEAEFGGHMIQQNVGGHPVAVFRFPPRTKFPASSTMTVWSGSNDPILHQPPTDYVWKEQQKWGTGPECTTILCKPNGQAIAWTTAAHRFSKNAFEEPTPGSQELVVEEHIQDDQNLETDSLTEMTVNLNEPKPDSVYLRREKQQPPKLSPQKHPHGSAPAKETHPHTGQPRPYTYGNDNSSVNRQSRSQTTRPDPIPGQPYAGSAQKMGSAPLKRYTPTNIRGNGSIVNKSDVGKTSSPPNPFMTPHMKFETGLNQIRSQHNEDFLPPMPRPPLFSTW